MTRPIFVVAAALLLLRPSAAHSQIIVRTQADVEAENAELRDGYCSIYYPHANTIYYSGLYKFSNNDRASLAREFADYLRGRGVDDPRDLDCSHGSKDDIEKSIYANPRYKHVKTGWMSAGAAAVRDAEIQREKDAAAAHEAELRREARRTELLARANELRARYGKKCPGWKPRTTPPKKGEPAHTTCQ